MGGTEVKLFGLHAYLLSTAKQVGTIERLQPQAIPPLGGLDEVTLLPQGNKSS